MKVFVDGYEEGKWNIALKGVGDVDAVWVKPGITPFDTYTFRVDLEALQEQDRVLDEAKKTEEPERSER